MKRIILVAVISLLTFTNVVAQDVNYGAKVGYTSFIARASFDGISSSSSVSGFHVGFFADIASSEKFHIQPELQLSIALQNGETAEMLVLPIMGKYYVTEKLNFQAGPQFDYMLESTEGIKSFGIGLGAGLGFDIKNSF